MFPRKFSKFLPLCGGSLSDEFDLISRSLDENILRRLRMLMTAPSNSLSSLLFAVEFLKSTHVEAQALVTNLKSTNSDFVYGSSGDQVQLHLHQRRKLCHFCSLIVYEVRVWRKLCICDGLDLGLAIKILLEGDKKSVPENLRKIRDSLTDWESKLRGGIVLPSRSDLGAMIGDLTTSLGRPPRGKISSATKLMLRTFYAVGLTTVFMAEVVTSSVYGLTDIGGVQAPAEFMWAEYFNHLQSVMCGEVKRRRRLVERVGNERLWLVDMDDLVARVVGVGHLFDDAISRGSYSNKNVVKLMSAVKELQTVNVAVQKGVKSLETSMEGLRDMLHYAFSDWY